LKKREGSRGTKGIKYAAKETRYASGINKGLGETGRGSTEEKPRGGVEVRRK